MLSIETVAAFDSAISNLNDSDIDSVPRLIMVGTNWRETIYKAVDLDKNTFKGDDFIVTCEREGFETIEAKGQLTLALHNALATIKKPHSMIITVNNIMTRYIKGRRAEKTLKFVYIVIVKN